MQRVFPIFLLPLFVSVASAGTGIATTTFTIPNQTGSTAYGLHVVLSATPNTFTSSTFPTVSQSGATFDFSGNSLLDGLNDTLFQQTYFSGTLNPTVSLNDYYWVDSSDAQLGSAYTPLLPEVADGQTIPGPCPPAGICGVNPNYYDFAIQNRNASDMQYDQANLTVNGTQLLSNGSGTVSASSTVDLASNTVPLQSFQFSYRDLTSGATQDFTFTPAPEPGTMALLGVALALVVGWRRRPA